MNKKIKIIKLLNKTANGEEIPKTVKCNGKKYNYHDYSKNYYYIEDTDECLFDDNIAFLANDEVEILEDNTEEIEEIDEEWTYIEGQVEKTWSKSELELVEKFNKLVKAVNKMKEGKE